MFGRFSIFSKKKLTILAKLLQQWQQTHVNPKLGFFLGSAAGTERDHLVSYSLGEPTRVWRINSAQDLVHFEDRLRVFYSRRPPQSHQSRPYFVGFFSFDAGRLFDPALSRLPMPKPEFPFPLGVWAEFPKVKLIDVRTMRSMSSQRALSKHEPKNTWAHYDRPMPKKFLSMVQAAKQHIAMGDIYQANLSWRFKRVLHKNPIEFYRVLSENNPSPYACLFKFFDRWLVCSSPELLCRVEDRRLITRPIAGTRPRGYSKQEDKKLIGQLLLSKKERAEHIMLVDLERNDVGRVCEAGSVRVTERCNVERYSHVMHIVSQVEGRLKKSETAMSALKALFPGGTITGCPKIRAIDIIERLEKKARGPFYGSAGFFTKSGNAVLNILIRSALVQKKNVYIQAGAGIVADSRAKREWREVCAKAHALWETVL